MARVQVTGPVLHYVAFPGDYNRVWFLGTARVAPRIRIETSYAPLVFQQGGMLLPFDLAYMGKVGRVVTSLNVFEDGVYRAVQASPRFTKTKLALGPGLDDFKAIGSTVQGDKGYFTLYLIYPYSGSANSPISNQPQRPYLPWGFVPYCYRFPCCTLDASDEDSGGTGERTASLAIRVNRVYYSRKIYKTAAGGSPLAGGFFLYDNAFPQGIELPPVVAA